MAASPQPPRILIADDQRDVLEALRLLLKNEGWDAETVTSPAGVLQALDASEFDAVLIDLNYTRDTTSGREGLDLLSGIQAADSAIPVVVMTAWSSVESAVEAMRRGARDYIEKPWDNARLIATLRTQVELGRALRRSSRLEAQAQLHADGTPALIAESPAMRPVLQAWAVECTPTHLAGAGVGLQFGITAIGASLGPMLAGIIADASDLYTGFYFLAATIIGANFLVFFVPNGEAPKVAAAAAR